jgi:hypothetical protein
MYTSSFQISNAAPADHPKRYFSPRAFLAGIGQKLKQLHLFQPIEQKVDIQQKSVRYSPIEKLYDALIGLLCGAEGIVEINKRVRPDEGLQRAFGRDACAEQSVVQKTLDACNGENVQQMQQAMDEIYRSFSQGYQHNYEQTLQILDVDMSGQPCGPKAAFATKGYFAKQRDRRGRQLGRVLASRYQEVVVDRLFDGKQQLVNALQPLMRAAEATLKLENAPVQREQTLVRVDSGGGSLKDINWLLERGYLFHGKDYSTQRARNLAQTVERWVDDPANPGRQVGWVTVAPSEYVRPVQRLAVRCRKNNGQWGIGVLVSALSAKQVLALTHRSLKQLKEPDAVLLAYVYVYDQRGGGVETSFKNDRQGLGMGKRNKKRFEAQQMLIQLGALAHNIIIWAKNWLRSDVPKLKHFGVLRLVRDLFTMSGFLVLDRSGRLEAIILNQADYLARRVFKALAALLVTEHVTVNLGEI